MKMLPVHQVERTQLVSAGWWRNALAGASQSPQWWQHWEQQGGTGFPSCLGQHSWAAGPWLLQCPGPGASLAMAETTTAVGRARATHIQFGASPPCSVFCTTMNWSYSLEPEHFLFSEQGHLPTFYIITEGKEYVLHLVGFFYTWKLTKDFGPFIEAEIHGHRRKGRKQLTQIQFLEIHPIDEVIGLFRCNGSSFFKLLFH